MLSVFFIEIFHCSLVSQNLLNVDVLSKMNALKMEYVKLNFAVLSSLKERCLENVFG